MRKLILSIVLLQTLLVSCSDENKTDQELLDRDKKELRENLKSSKVTFYKFGKIAVRSSASKDTKSAEFKSFKSSFDRVYKNLVKHNISSEESLSLLDYVSIYRDYNKMEDFIMKTDEDKFPTLIEAFALNGDEAKINKHKYLKGEEKEFVENVEHSVLSAVVLLSRNLGKEVALYECAETNPGKLPDSEIKTLLHLFRGFLFFEKGYYYLSEDEISKNITWLNKNEKVDLPYTRSIFKWNNQDNVKTHLGLHAFNHLFRGFDRLMMERTIDEKRALQDFEMFLKDANKIGLDDELTWSIESYLYLKNEENEKAIASLTKLKSSDLLSSKEKESIDESIAYLKNREPGKVLNGAYDKYFLSKIATKYVFAILSEVDWKKNTRRTRSTSY